MKIAAVTALAAIALAACASQPVAKQSLAANAAPPAGVTDPSKFKGRSADYGDLGLWRSAYVNGEAYANKSSVNNFPAGVLGYEPQYTVGPAHQ